MVASLRIQRQCIRSGITDRRRLRQFDRKRIRIPIMEAELARLRITVAVISGNSRLRVLSGDLPVIQSELKTGIQQYISVKLNIRHGRLARIDIGYRSLDLGKIWFRNTNYCTWYSYEN